MHPQLLLDLCPDAPPARRGHRPVPPRVLESHRFYADWGQEECSTSRFLAAHGHPMAAAYRQARALFDGLAYACNAGARFYAFEDETNYAQYWAPGLTLSWEPSWRGFGSVYPAQGERWDAYLRAAAEAGYPEKTRPAGDLGRWIVQLSREEDRQAFQGHLARVQLGAFDFTCSTLEQLHAVRAAVDAVLGDWVLPPRTPEMDGADHAEIPLADRPLVLAAVDRVTSAPRAVLVPLIPFGQPDFLHRTVSDILALIEQGWAWRHADEWLEKFLQPTAYRALKIRHTQGVEPRQDQYAEAVAGRVRTLPRTAHPRGGRLA